jgi:hypothetical protein
MLWTPTSNRGFEVKSYYNTLQFRIGSLNLFYPSLESYFCILIVEHLEKKIGASLRTGSLICYV